jgi:MFS family permease
LFYVVALVPLAIVTYLRRNLKETRAFGAAMALARVQHSWWPQLERPDRAKLWRLTLLLGLTGMLGTSAFFYAAELAQDDYGWKGLFTVIVFAAAPTTLLGYLAGGRLSDRFGRKPVLVTAVLFFGGGALLVFTELRVLYAPGFFLLAGADAAVQAVRTAFVGELFPTEVRATLASFVGAVNVAAGSMGLVIVGVLSSTVDSSTVIVALALCCTATVVLTRKLPETAGIDVINSAQASANPS